MIAWQGHRVFFSGNILYSHRAATHPRKWSVQENCLNKWGEEGVRGGGEGREGRELGKGEREVIFDGPTFHPGGQFWDF